MKNNILIGWIFVCLLHTTSGSSHGVSINADDPCRRGESAMDRAWVTIETKCKITEGMMMELHGQMAACYKCKLAHIVDIPLDKNCTIQLPTMFTNTLEVRMSVDQQPFKRIWKSEVEISEHSEYRLQIFENSSYRGDHYTNFYTETEAMDVNLPIYVALCVLVACAAIWVVLRKFGVLTEEHYKKLKAMVVSSETLVQAGLLQDLGSTEGEVSPPTVTTVTSVTPQTESKKKRLRSLDAFRGICLCVMIFVNYGGGGYWFFDHSYWNGLTVADLVFPWFTWIIGTAVALAFRSQIEKGVRKAAMTQKVLIRTVILFVLGIALESSDGSASVSMSHLRIPGVLQRLAVSYAVVALIQIHYADDYVTNPHRNKGISPVRDILPYWMEWIFMLVLVTVHLVLTFLVQVPGCPVGYVGPGGLAENGKYHDCTGGAASYIDRWLFGQEHIYQTPTCKEVYQTTVPHDPEGLLGTLTSIFMCFLGLQAGKILLLYDDWLQRTIRWLTWGFLLGLLAGCLCRFTQNDGWIPVNKNLWSVTFVLCLSSMAFFLFTACYLSIDVFKLWTGAPFVYPGMNSILVYVCHLVFTHYFPVSWSVAKQHASLLPLHLWGVTFWTGVAATLYYKKIFVAI